MVINKSFHYYNSSNERESQFIINKWKYNQLKSFMYEIEKKIFYNDRIG